MASGDDESQQVSSLIERLLVDPAFRAEFRRDPPSACRALGLTQLAQELGAGRGAMHTLELRESKSSLAGVVMAVAAEGFALAELSHLMPGLQGQARASGALRGGKARNPLAGLNASRHADPLKGAAHNPLRAVGHGAGPASPNAATSSSPGAAGAAPGPTSAAGAAGGVPAAPGASAGATATGGPAGIENAPAAPAGISNAPAGPAGISSAPAGVDVANAHAAAAGAATPAPTGPPPGVQPTAPGATPAWPDVSPNPSPAGPAGVYPPAPAGPQASLPGSASLADISNNPRLSLPADVRAMLSQGGLDPRIASVLGSTLANHTISIGTLQSVVEPVHAQSIDIVAVDGQPVGPTNIAARDLITEIAALDPSVRPSEIGTPWPIHSPGFFTDLQHQDRLHLGFVSGADYRAPVAVSAVPPVTSAVPSGGATPGVQVGDPSAGAAVRQVAGVAPTAAPPIAARQSGGGGAAAALAYARSMVGKLPEIGGNNIGPALDRYEADFGFHGAAWCGIFAGHALEAAGLKVPHTVASVAAILDLARSGDGPFEKGILPVSAIRPGDLVTFGGTEHVAIVTSVDAQGVHTIAGNTSQGNVSATTYSPSQVTGVVRPKYGPPAADVRVMPAVSPAGAPALASVAPGPAATAGAGAPALIGDAPPAGGVPAPGAPLQPAASAPATASFRAAGIKAAAPPRPTARFIAAVKPPSPPHIPATAPGPGATEPLPVGSSPLGSDPPPSTVEPGQVSAASPGAGAGQLADLASGASGYPGDNASQSSIARWMADEAQRHGLPRQLPVMAALVESSLHNVPSGDRDSVGYFQMRTSVWDSGPYAGFTHNANLQLKWFIDQAVAVKNARLASDPSFGQDPSQYGNWIADIERPAAEFRGRYQLRLDEARQLLGG